MDYGFRLDEGETINKIIRRHFMDVVPTLLISALLFLVSGALTYIWGRFPATIPFSPTLMAAIIAALLVIAALIVLVALYVYQRNVLIFTNVHLVHVEQLALFSRRVSQLNFKRIEDVTGLKQGILQNIFNYWQMEVQSAGEQEKFIFKNAPDPTNLADEVLSIHEACLREAGQTEGPKE